MIQEQRPRVIIFMRTVSAAFLPFGTAVLCTPAGERPTVMKGPDDRDILLDDVFEQHTDIDETVTERMQVDEIGLDLIEPSDQNSRIEYIERTVISGNITQTFADDLVEPGTDQFLIVFLALVSFAGVAEEQIHVKTGLAGLFGDIDRDGSGRSVIDAVDLYDCFHHLDYNIEPAYPHHVIMRES